MFIWDRAFDSMLNMSCDYTSLCLSLTFMQIYARRRARKKWDKFLFFFATHSIECVFRYLWLILQHISWCSRWSFFLPPLVFSTVRILKASLWKIFIPCFFLALAFLCESKWICIFSFSFSLGKKKQKTVIFHCVEKANIRFFCFFGMKMMETSWLRCI